MRDLAELLTHPLGTRLDFCCDGNLLGDIDGTQVESLHRSRGRWRARRDLSSNRVAAVRVRVRGRVEAGHGRARHRAPPEGVGRTLITSAREQADRCALQSTYLRRVGDKRRSRDEWSTSRDLAALRSSHTRCDGVVRFAPATAALRRTATLVDRARGHNTQRTLRRGPSTNWLARRPRRSHRVGRRHISPLRSTRDACAHALANGDRTRQLVLGARRGA